MYSQCAARCRAAGLENSLPTCEPTESNRINKSLILNLQLHYEPVLDSPPPHHPPKPFSVVVKFIVGKLLNFTLVPGNPERALTLAQTTFSQLIMCGRVTPRAVRLPDTNHIHVNEHGGLGLFESLSGKQASQEIK